MNLHHKLKLMMVCLLLSQSASCLAQSNVPVGASEWYLGTPDNVPEYVMEIGKGKTIVVIHGGFGAEHSYLLDPFLFLSKDYRVVFYDQRGSLRSRPNKADVSIELLVDDLELLRKQLGEDKITLLSHSMGSATAIAYTEKYAQHVQGLVLTAPVLPLVSNGQGTLQEDEFISKTDREAFEKRSAILKQESERKILEETNRQNLPARPKSVEEYINTAGVGKSEFTRWRIQFGGVNLYHTERWASVKGGQAFFSFDVAGKVWKNSSYEQVFGRMRNALEKYNGPVSIILGDHDYCDPGAVIWKRIASKLHQGAISILPDAGHSYWVDQPEKSQIVLKEALTRVHQ